MGLEHGDRFPYSVFEWYVVETSRGKRRRYKARWKMSEKEMAWHIEGGEWVSAEKVPTSEEVRTYSPYSHFTPHTGAGAAVDTGSTEEQLYEQAARNRVRMDAARAEDRLLRGG